LKRIANFIPLIALLALTLFVFAGCGDDGSTTIVTPGGATGPTGATGVTGITGVTGVTGPVDLVDLTIDMWEGAAGGTRVADPFRVTLVRTIGTAEADEITVSDSTAEGQAVITDLPSGADYDITVAVFGRIPQTQHVKTVEATSSISSSQTNTQQTVNFENFGTSNSGLCYAANGYYDDIPLYLYILDPNNPSPDNQVGLIRPSGPLSALAFAPASDPNALPTLYGVIGYDAGNSGMTLVTIDPFTGGILTSTPVSCSTANIHWMEDITVDSNGNMYGFGNANTWTNTFLGSINPSTGAVNIISGYPYPYYGNSTDGIAFDPNGVLYHVSTTYESSYCYTNLGTLDVTTGARTYLRDLSQNVWFSGGIDFYNNTLYGHGAENSTYVNLLHTIDINTGTVTTLNGGIPDCEGIAFPK